MNAKMGHSFEICYQKSILICRCFFSVLWNELLSWYLLKTHDYEGFPHFISCTEGSIIVCNLISTYSSLSPMETWYKAGGQKKLYISNI